MINVSRDERQKLKGYLSSIQEVFRTNNIDTEESTKMSLILPVFKYLGYDVFNPEEFCPEVSADVGVGIKNGEKVDYAIKSNKRIRVLVECKHHKERNLNKHVSQLFRYFAVTSAKLGVLTNGIEWRFYSDLKQPNIMDTECFYSFRIDNISDFDLGIIPQFAKSVYSEKCIKEIVELVNDSEKYESIHREKIYDFFRNQDRYIDADYANIVFDIIFGRDIPTGQMDKTIKIMQEAIRDVGISSVRKTQYAVTTEVAEVSKREIVKIGDSVEQRVTSDGIELKLLDVILSRQELSFFKLNSVVNKRTGEIHPVKTWALFIETILNEAINNGMTQSEMLSMDNRSTENTGWLRLKYDGVPTNACQKFVRLGNGVWLNTYGNASAMCQKLYKGCLEYEGYFRDLYIVVHKKI